MKKMVDEWQAGRVVLQTRSKLCLVYQQMAILLLVYGCQYGSVGEVFVDVAQCAFESIHEWIPPKNRHDYFHKKYVETVSLADVRQFVFKNLPRFRVFQIKRFAPKQVIEKGKRRMHFFRFYQDYIVPTNFFTFCRQPVDSKKPDGDASQ